VPNPNPYDEHAYNDAAIVLRAAIASLWKAGATAGEIEDEAEDAKRQAGVEE
jgi:hypothetical protein